MSHKLDVTNLDLPMNIVEYFEFALGGEEQELYTVELDVGVA